MYEAIVKMAFTQKDTAEDDALDTGLGEKTDISQATDNITVGNHAISIIFTVHNVCRQARNDTNMIKKTL